MNALISLPQRPGRAAAVAGAVLALTTTATVALVTTASADEPGRCLENVNVREKPDVNARIVALCDAGTEVEVSETRDGFVHLTDLGGWAAQQYVAVNGRPAASEQDTPEMDQETGQDTGQDENSDGDNTDGNSGGGGLGSLLG